MSNNRFILRSTDGGRSNLFTSAMLHSLCNLEDESIRSYYGYKNGGHSVAFYVAGLANKTCAEINQSDVEKVGQLLVDCVKYYDSGSLKVFS